MTDGMKIGIQHVVPVAKRPQVGQCVPFLIVGGIGGKGNGQAAVPSRDEPYGFCHGGVVNSGNVYVDVLCSAANAVRHRHGEGFRFHGVVVRVVMEKTVFLVVEEVRTSGCHRYVKLFGRIIRIRHVRGEVAPFVLHGVYPEQSRHGSASDIGEERDIVHGCHGNVEGEFHRSIEIIPAPERDRLIPRPVPRRCYRGDPGLGDVNSEVHPVPCIVGRGTERPRSLGVEHIVKIIRIGSVLHQGEVVGCLVQCHWPRVAEMHAVDGDEERIIGYPEFFVLYPYVVCSVLRYLAPGPPILSGATGIGVKIKEIPGFDIDVHIPAFDIRSHDRDVQFVPRFKVDGVVIIFVEGTVETTFVDA